MTTRDLEIADKIISDGTDAYVIAEIGHNHEGDLGKAEELVRKAAAAGASAAKLQKRDNHSLYTRAMFNEPYTGRNSYGPTYGLHREALEFGRSEYIYLLQLAVELGVDFISTAFDFPSVDFLTEIGVPAIKLASADLTNTPLLSCAAKSGKPLIISTGGANMDDVRRAVDTVLPINENLALLQCTAVYPASPADLNLSVISRYRKEFPSVVAGFSGHDSALNASWIAYALGARVIEKHVTLDRTRPGSDHHFSLEPSHLTELVAGLRSTRESIGSPDKRALPEESAAMRKMGKKLVAARDLPAGHHLTDADIAIKSPGGDGMQPYLLPDVIGRSLKAPLETDAALASELLG